MRSETMTTLLVEDNEGDIILMKKVFEKTSLKNKLEIISDGEEALEFVMSLKDDPSNRPDLIILDINLPKVDGITILQKLRATKELASMPVIILTTSDEKKDIKNAYSNHANCFITKPYDYQEYLKVIEKIDHFWFEVVSLI